MNRGFQMAKQGRTVNSSSRPDFAVKKADNGWAYVRILEPRKPHEYKL